MTDVKTKVSEADIDIEGILDPSSIVVPEDEKPKIFKRDDGKTTFIDKTEPDPDPDPDPKPDPDPDPDPDDDPKDPDPKDPKDPDPDDPSNIDDIVNPDPDGDDDPKDPDVTVEGMAGFVSKLIKDKKLVPFEDDKPLDQYTIEDFEELFEANFSDIESRLSKEIPEKFFKSLPPELQYAAAYVNDGGKDLKSLFKMLAANEEINELDPSVEGNDEAIIRTYLQATRFGTDEEIQEEIDDWKDRGDLEAKAKKFKPKLKALHEEILQDKLERQNRDKQKKQAQARKYMDDIYELLAPGELNGIKLDKKIQGLLYTGLTQPQYSSVSGSPTNLLGHLLEKHQFVEPNHSLIAEALWLLADPDGYKAKLKEGAAQKVVKETARKLKTESSKRIAGTQEDPDDDAPKPKRTIKRSDQGSFFRR